MFRKRFAWIVSDEGFSVRASGRAEVEYREGKKRLRADVEMLVNPPGFALYKSSIRTWQPPHERELIDDARRDAIAQNIRRAFEFAGFQVEIA